MWLWVISAASSVATALIPLDQNLALHALVSTPVIFAQPAALPVLGITLRRHHRVIGRIGVTLGIISTAAAVPTLLVLTIADTAGAMERPALWPAYFWLAVVAVVVLRTERNARRSKLPAP